MTRAGQPPHPYGPGYGPDNPGYGPVPQPPRRPKRTLRRVLLALLGFGVLLVVAAMIFGKGTAPTRNVTDGATEKAGTLSALDLRAGDCYNSKQLPPEPGSAQPISTVEVVPCTSGHTAQVVDKVTYKVTDSLADVRATRSGADCNTAFKAKVQPTVLNDAKFQLGLISPRDEATWLKHPVIACVVAHPSTTTTLLK
ncbi:hypothetical protein [Pseudonocardia sp. GCM10023141]|uniref:hypothetical protein n=1 Tax=Pseudonocardia sp. GCM10023141 TaxID=3252653 RepID=UPI0036110F45